MGMKIPKDILNIHKAFIRNGYKLYIVGGAVRDYVLGLSPKDFDLATDAKPEDVLKIANREGFHSTEVGKAFGVVVLNGHEIATFRKDIGTGRRPSAVDYTDIEGDVRRRDLTINALFYDISRREIVDLVGGIADLKRNKIKTVGNAIERFSEDALRKLRALRFAAKLGGKFDRSTYEAIAADPSLPNVSIERIRDEFVKSIQSAKSTRKYLQIADATKILPLIFPNLKYNKRDFVEQNNHVLLIAYLFRQYTPKRVHDELKRLTYTTEEAEAIKYLLQLQDFDPINIVKLKRQHHTLSDSEILEWGTMIGKNFKKFVQFQLSVDAKELMRLGYKGRELGDEIDKRERARYLGLKESLDTLKNINSFKDLFNILPNDLQKLVYNLKNTPQRPDYHPEGNTLKHTIVVVNRALKERDLDMAIAAIFHDLGKPHTTIINPKTGYPSQPGHEKYSAKYVKEYANWIKEIGANPANIYYIVRNHMKFKILKNPNKIKKLKSFRAADKLSRFSKHDRGGFDI